MRLFGSIWPVQLVNERLNLAREAVAEIIESAAPDITLLESSEIESRHDTKIVAASAQTDPKIRVFLRVRFDYFTGSQNYLEIKDLYVDN